MADFSLCCCHMPYSGLLTSGEGRVAGGRVSEVCLLLLCLFWLCAWDECHVRTRTAGEDTLSRGWCCQSWLTRDG